MDVKRIGYCGPPTYPFWKVAVAEGGAEIAEIACDSWATESLVYHSDLVSRLQERFPELDMHTHWYAGWLTREGDEATLRLQVTGAGLTDDHVTRVGQAMAEWGDAAGVRNLSVADSSRRDSAVPDSEDGWELP
jgi:hypothetical protein